MKRLKITLDPISQQTNRSLSVDQKTHKLNEFSLLNDCLYLYILAVSSRVGGNDRGKRLSGKESKPQQMCRPIWCFKNIGYYL